jgi:ribosomal protein S18 acetylase RimI-like enzyme
MTNNYQINSFFKKILLLMLATISVCSGIWIFQKNTAFVNISDYKPERDRAFILDIFKKDFFWLVADEGSETFSAEYMLDNRTSSRRPVRKGNLIIKVYTDEGNPAAFIAYYTKKLYEGYILFISVGEKYRKKGYARTLIKYALEDLKRRGSSVVRMLTRNINKPARSLYESLGFKQYWTDGKYVRYEKYLE